MPDRSTLVIVGAGDLLGRELAQTLRTQRLDAALRLLDDPAAESETAMEIPGETSALVEPVSEAALAGADVVFFAGSQVQARRWFDAARHAARSLFDLSGGLEDEPDAQCLTPEQWNGQPLSAAAGRLWLIPHPVAALLYALLPRIGGLAPIEAASATVLQPASEFGQSGMDELQAQTRNLLTFQPLPTLVFGGQSAFNLHAALPAELQPTLAETAALIGRHLQRLAALDSAPIPLPGIQVLQAPWFYGHGLSLYFQTRSPLDAAALSRALYAQDAPPDMLSAVSAEQPLIGPVQPDASQPRGYWLFCALDRMRLAARMAAQLAELALQERIQ